MSRPPRRRTPPQLCPEPPRIRSHTPPPPKRTGASGQRSPERRARSPGPMRVKRPLRNSSPPHRSRSPLERRPTKSGPPAREFAPPPRTEREPPLSPRPRGKRDFRGAGTSDTPVASRSRRSRSRSPVAAERSSKDRPFPAKRPSSGPLETVVNTYSGSDRNKFKSGADFQGEDEDELERPIFRGPDSGKTGYDLSELKKIQVQILRKIKTDGTVDNVNRTVPNLEEITPVRRFDSSVSGADAKNYSSSQNRNGRGMRPTTDIWDEDPSRSHFHQPRDWAEFKNEGNRPIFERFANQKVEKPPESNKWTVYRRSHSPTGRDNSRLDGPSRIDSNPDRYPVDRYPAERERDRDRDRERERDREGRVPFEPQKYHEPLDPHEKRSYSYGRSGGDDLRQAIERRRDDSRYPQPDFRNESHEKSRPVPESNFRGRVNERRPDHNYKHDEREKDRNKERPRERERERTDYQPPRKPMQDRRKGSPGASSRRPSDRDPDFDRERHRGDKEQWERERGREVDVDRRRRPKSRERDDDRRETRPREGRPPRRPDDRPEHRGSYKNSDYPQDKEEVEEEEYDAAPAAHHAGRGGRGRGGRVGGWGAPHPPGRGGGMYRGGAPRGAMRGVMRPLPPPYQPFFPPPVRPMPMMPIRGYPPRKSPEAYSRNRSSWE